MSECLGDKLPEQWWRDEEALRAELAAHGSLAAAARAHGISESTVKSSWSKIKKPGENLPRSVAKVQEIREQRDLEDPERLREEQRQAEVRHLRAEHKRLIAERANREAIIERIVDAARVPVEVPRYAVRKQTKSLPVRSAVLPVFDCQFGQLVQPDDTPLGIGGFNTDVFDERLQRWLDAVTGSMRDYAASHRVTELVIPFGGDMVEGEDIFAGQAWQLELDPARQTVEFARRWTKVLSDTLIPFVKEEIGVEKLMVVCVPGNHGKVGGKRKGATPSTMSWDWLAFEWMRDALRAEPINEFAIEPGGAVLFETAGHLFLTIHGDEIKGWGGLPFYGLTRYDGRAIRMTGEVYDYCLLGHHHQPASIPNGSGGEFIVSGDWVGGNNLSRFLAAASRPQQRLLFVGEKYGITENIPIYLEEHSRRERPYVYTTQAA